MAAVRPEVQATSGATGVDRLITAESLARLLSLSTRTVWRLRSAGKLPRPVQIGGAVRWRDSDIAEWIRLGCPSLHEFEVRAGKKRD